MIFLILYQKIWKRIFVGHFLRDIWKVLLRKRSMPVLARLRERNSCNNMSQHIRSRSPNWCHFRKGAKRLIATVNLNPSGKKERYDIKIICLASDMLNCKDFDFVRIIAFHHESHFSFQFSAMKKRRAGREEEKTTFFYNLFSLPIIYLLRIILSRLRNKRLFLEKRYLSGWVYWIIPCHTSAAISLIKLHKCLISKAASLASFCQS